jgi:hypothetical protein
MKGRFSVTVMDEFANKMMEHMPEKVEADISTLILKYLKVCLFVRSSLLSPLV